MRTRQLGNTDLHLTVIGLGAWAMGGPFEFGWGPQDDDDSIATIRRALDLGINWIDTAPAYGYGHSEEIVGRALRGMAQRPFIATKCSRVWEQPGAPLGSRLKAWSIREEAEASLRRLGVDVIDLYQVHRPVPDEDLEEAWGEIAALVAEGKVRYAGVSNFTVSQIQRLQPILPVASLQPPLHMLDRSAEAELLPFCQAEGLGITAYSPMASGLLTGKYNRETLAQLAPDDWRRKHARFSEPELTPNLALVAALRPIAARLGVTLSQLAIAWVTAHPAVTSAIVGARRPDQIEETAPAAPLDLPEDAAMEINVLLARREASLKATKAAQ